jgi:hypothetical protein
VFAGLAGRLLAGPLDHPSAALTGLAIFVNFGTGVLVQTTTTRWPARRLIAAGIVPTLVGLIVLVVSAWTASLALFFLAAVIGGAGGGAIFRGSLVLAVSTADPANAPARWRRTSRRATSECRSRDRPRRRAAVRDPARRAADLCGDRRDRDTGCRAGPHRCEEPASEG